MEDQLSRIEASIRDLDARLRVLERTAAVIADNDVVAGGEVELSLPPALQRQNAADLIAFAGRAVVAMGGAYLLRALSDSHVLPLVGGVALAFAYAACWLAAADRDGGRGRVASAIFHAVVASSITFPLIWEATSRFSILTAPQSAAAVGAATLAILGVALHRQLQAIAWLAVVPALTATVALTTSTGETIPFATCLVVLGVATLWVGYAWDWIGLRWPVALIADLTVLALAFGAVGVEANGATDSALGVLSVQMLLLNGYVGSVAIRTIVRARDVIAFEIVQTAAALLVGLGGAVYVAQLSGTGVEALALLNLGFGAGCYAVAFVFVRDRPRNFYFYSTLALLLVVAGAWLLLPPTSLAVAFDALALASTWMAARVGRVALTAHAAMYLSAAAVASHLLSLSAQALAGPVVATWQPMPAPALATLGAVAICWYWPTPGRAAMPPHEWVPRVLIAVLLVLAGAGWIVGAATPLLAGIPGRDADSGVVATIRTTALATAAVLFGRFGRDARFRESLWLLYPVLLVGGLKLLVEDFPQSKPATLFVALGVYGGALIVAPRIAKTGIKN